jgi:UDP-N-acetylglucosamine--dolichyl-phosphate N-acetylglucosaminephosphotransferase
MSFLPAAIASAIAFLVTYFLTPVLIRYLNKHGMLVKDYHKPNNKQVPRPGGPSIIVAIIAAELSLFIFTMSNGILAILACTVIAFFIGYVDDRRVMPGYFKPLALVAAAIPIILLNAYDFYLDFPFFGSARIPALYIVLILAAIPVMGNTVNSIDVLNGVVSGFIAIASVPLIITLFLQGKVDIAIAALPLLLSALAFYKYHKYPSRIFPGDSGTLAWGAMYGAIAIVGGVEFVAIVALLPAVINSFLFLASVKRVTEHREVKARPTVLLDDYRLMASNERNAPVTLVRLVLAHGPMREDEIARSIFKLAAFSAGIAILTAVLIGVRI